MTRQKINFEDCVRLHYEASPDRQREGLRAWAAILAGEKTKSEPEPFQNLKITAKAVNHSPSHLWRLGIKAVDEGFGGRPRYRLSRVLEYLRSEKCQKRREELREARRKQGKEEA
jgi:hypothetical protein